MPKRGDSKELVREMEEKYGYAPDEEADIPDAPEEHEEITPSGEM